MKPFTPRTAFIVIAIVVLAVTMLSACQEPGQDPYQAGQQMREQVDQAMQELGQFVAGFCSASPVSLLLVGLAALLIGKQSH